MTQATSSFERLRSWYFACDSPVQSKWDDFVNGSEYQRTGLRELVGGGYSPLLAHGFPRRIVDRIIRYSLAM